MESLKNKLDFQHRYSGTIAGLIFAIPFFITLINKDVAILRVFAIFFFVPIAFPLEIIGRLIFNNFTLTTLLVFLGLVICLYFSSSHYFRNMIIDRNERNPLIYFRIWTYLFLQLIIIHPLIFYFITFITSADSRDFIYLFYTYYSFPISSIIIIGIGVIIDIVKNKNIEN